MAIPTNSKGALDLMRLSQLKNVSGRGKVVPGAQFMQELQPEADIEGTAPPFTAPQNLPEPEMGGQLTPQSYDVRANAVMPPDEGEGEESMWTRLGRSLAGFSGLGGAGGAQSSPPPIETQQVEEQEGLPPVNPQEEQGFLSRLAKAFTPGEGVKKAIQEGTALAPEFQEQFPEVAKTIPQFNQQATQGKQLDQAELDAAQANPMTIPVYGATDAFANRPELVQQFGTYTGIDFTPEIQAQTDKYEQVMSDIEKGLNQQGEGYDEQAQRIRQRIESNTATDMDKYYIGLALLMPLLVGGLFGKEAGLGALAGGTKSFGDVLGQRAQNVAADEELLADINKQKGNLGIKKAELDLEKLKIPGQIQKNLPTDELEHLKGAQTSKWTNPETGEMIEGVEVAPGFFVQTKYARNQKSLEGKEKAAAELAGRKTYVQGLSDLTEDAVNIISQLKDSHILGAAFKSALAGKSPGLASRLTQDVNFEGRKVNAGIELDNILGMLANYYAQANQLGQLDRAAQAHVSKIISNPVTSFATPKDAINQLISVTNTAQRNFVNEAKNRGFEPDPIISEFGQRRRSLYGGLNEKEDEKEIKADKQKLMRKQK